MIDIHTLYGKTPYGQNYSFESVLQGWNVSTLIMR